jgi:hypothetical protein
MKDEMTGTCSVREGDKKYVQNSSWQTCRKGTRRVILTWLEG